MDLMGISETKMKIVIDNYFKSEYNVDTSIRQAFEKGFRIGVQKGITLQPERKKGKWIPVDSFSAFGGDESMWIAHGNPVAFYYCSSCKEQAYAGEDGQSLITDFCPNCGADMRGEENG